MNKLQVLLSWSHFKGFILLHVFVINNITCTLINFDDGQWPILPISQDFQFEV